MLPPLKFSIKGATIRGEWDEANKMVLIDELDGDLVIETKFMGFAVNVRGAIDTAMDNCVRVKIHSISHAFGKIPGSLIPGILNMLRNFNQKFAQSVSVERDMIMVDPGRLLPDSAGMKVLVQPRAFEIPDQAVASLRERVLAWTEKNGGAVAKELMDIILTIPDLVALLVALARDPRIGYELKLKIALCVAYVISPLDLVPEILAGPLGLVDDAAAVWLLMASLAAEIPGDLIREHWKGRPDTLELLMQGHALAVISSKLPTGIWQKLVSLFGNIKSKAAAGQEDKEGEWR